MENWSEINVFQTVLNMSAFLLFWVQHIIMASFKFKTFFDFTLASLSLLRTSFLQRNFFNFNLLQSWHSSSTKCGDFQPSMATYFTDCNYRLLPLRWLQPSTKLIINDSILIYRFNEPVRTWESRSRKDIK